MDIVFFINSVLFGIGLAMDAFSVSVANGLNEPGMRLRKMLLTSGVFGGFQTMMPLIGWFFVHAAAERFEKIQKIVPFIALALLLFIGGQMIIDGVKGKKEEREDPSTGISALLIQGVATSIDALSVGFTIAELNFVSAITEAVIIGAVTFALCFAALKLGKRFGERLAGKAGIVGGAILIAIGVEIFVKGVFFK